MSNTPKPIYGLYLQIISTEARIIARDGRVLAHGTSTLVVVSAEK